VTDSLALRTRYWDDPEARAAFNRFMIHTFRLDFGAWEAAGYWDDAYTPFSLFAGGEVAASVCVYLLDFIIDGRPARLAQISGVGTRPEFRRRGLNRQLTEIALEWAEGQHRGVFLFADLEAVPFYQKCGFTPIEEYLACADVAPVQRRAGAVRLDPALPDDRDRVFAHAEGRAPVSLRFGVLSARLLMFHAQYTLQDAVWQIPELGCVVFFRRTGDRVSVYDIVGENIPRWDALYPYLAEPGDRTVEFYFTPDRLGLAEFKLRPLAGNYPFVRGAFPVDRPVFPFTSMA
jgi:GNAT superfamily N-acetyltransferase